MIDKVSLHPVIHNKILSIMAKKELCNDSFISVQKLDRSIIAKVGHIKREIDTNNRLSDKSIERLKKILSAKSNKGDFGGPDDYFDKIFESIEKYRNFDKLNDEQKFWVYELMEETQWQMIEVDPESF